MTPELNPETSPELIAARLRGIARQNSSLRVTPPDWRIGRRGQPDTAKAAAKVRRRQQAESRKRNR